jgi:Phosphotransferase enzyme family
LSKRDHSLARATEVARRLIGGTVEVSPLVTSGRNSRIWRVSSADRVFALKQYPSRCDDPRERLSTEVGALQLMERCRIASVPQVIGIDGEGGYVLLSWIEGRNVTDVCDADIDAAVAFLSAIHGLRETLFAPEQPLAAEACLSGYKIEQQIEGRLAQLRGVAAKTKKGELDDFLDHSFAPCFSVVRAQARSAITATGLNFVDELPLEWRSLVPSDFGFHNSLRRSDGSLAFVDFEYFGWDDPVKLTADILLHPGRALAMPQRARFRRAAAQLYGSDPAFTPRLRAYLPLFGLRWVLIMLNEFIPHRWQQRVLAGDTASWVDAKARQLTHAREFLATLPQKAEIDW